MLRRRRQAAMSKAHPLVALACCAAGVALGCAPALAASGGAAGASGRGGAKGAPHSAAATALSAHLASVMSLAGPGSGAYVYDITTGRLLFSERAANLHPPASVEKLYTATTALDRMGPTARLQTTVLASGTLAPGGTLTGNLYLRGGGDPTFGSAAFVRARYGGVGSTVQALAAALVKRGLRRVSGRVFGDESYFDSRRGEPSSGYAFDPYLEGVLSALAYDRGESGPYRGPHAPAEEAAAALVQALRADHVAVNARVGAAVTPAGATLLADERSPTLAQLLGLMLPPSDNFFAETLVKDLGARYGGAGTTAAGAAVVRRTIAALVGVHPQVVDGSGLSTSDLTSPQQVATLLEYLASHPLGATLRDSLAIAGRTGTLSDRMLHSAATGRCRAKTGTLTGVSNLAGYCTAADGDLIAFAIFNDGIPLETAHTLQDNIAISIARF